ncbi:hypothetical protein OAO18_01800 [Francisellaceae bacterium]|nr:hypothetical protein [Francisellaceae bacterium]
MKKVTTLIISIAILSTASFANHINIISYKEIKQNSITTNDVNSSAQSISLD